MLKSTSNNLFTTKYSYGNNDNEFVLCCKGRPFAVLVSPSLQTPTASLMDFDLVRSLGLKMTSLQCRKFNYSGYKLRVLGRVTTAVQCVQNGKLGHTFHLKCDVVSDLYTTLDTHCVASAGLQQHLGTQKTIIIGDDGGGNQSNVSSSAPPPPVRNAAPPAPTASAAPPEPPTAGAASPTATTSSAPSAPTPRTPPRASAAPPAAAQSPRSPPGFPATPQHSASSPSTATEAGTEATIPVRRVVDGLELSPFSANIRALGETFQDADLERTENDQIQTLEEVDEDGYLDTDGHGGDYMFTFTNRLRYSVKHGRHGCSRNKCAQSNLSKKPYFHNCGYHPQWHLPLGFTPCGDRCKGGFCFCLRKYNRQVCPDFAAYQTQLRRVRLEEEEEKKRRGRR